MSEGPQMDQGALNFARGVGQGGKSKTDDYVNQESASTEHSKAAIDQAADAAKMSLSFIGKLALIFSGTGANAGLENEGVTGKMIMPSFLPDLGGGFLARLMHAVFLKNREVTDHTQSVGGGEGIGPASGGDGGGDYSSLVGAPNSYGDHDWSPASRADLGTFSPPNVGDAGAAIQLDR